MNQQQNNWGRRKDKWPGGQNGGDHCHRTEYRKKKKKMRRNDDSLWGLWDSIKYTNIHIIGVPEGEEWETGPEKIFEEIIAQNFPNIRKEIVNQV